MEFLGIGPLELLFVVIIALIVLGPKDMVKAGKTIGRTLRKIVTSPSWRAIQQTSHELRQLPNRLMREAGIEELQQNLPKPDEIVGSELGIDEMKKNMSDINEELSDWTTPPPSISPRAADDQAPEQPSSNPTESQPEQD